MGEEYQGAKVLDPIPKFYKDPIATLDFAALYPSIIIAENICYSTLVVDKTAVNESMTGLVNIAPTVDETTWSERTMFVKPDVVKGILPTILEKYLTQRRAVREKMKTEKDPVMLQNYDCQQLELKRAANSIYGFTGARDDGALSCVAISSSITGFGRSMIEVTRDFVEENYDATVVYGDTDSVMISFKGLGLPETFKTANEAAEKVSALFKRPIKLEFEKVYFPFLLCGKKRYAGVHYTDIHKHNKLDVKGLEVVRRDSCPWVAQVMKKILDILMFERDIEKMLQYLKTQTMLLMNEQIDPGLLILTRKLTKPHYKVAQPHSVLVEKLRLTDPNQCPEIGDRVPYFIGEEGGKKISDRAIAPSDVFRTARAEVGSGVPIDARETKIDLFYYLNKQLRKPVERLLANVVGSDVLKDIFKDAEGAASGDGGYDVSTDDVSTDDGYSGGAMKRKRPIVSDIEDMVAKCESNFNKCRDCQGDNFKKSSCKTYDCPIHFSRKLDIKRLGKVDGIAAGLIEKLSFC